MKGPIPLMWRSRLLKMRSGELVTHCGRNRKRTSAFLHSEVCQRISLPFVLEDHVFQGCPGPWPCLLFWKITRCETCPPDPGLACCFRRSRLSNCPGPWPCLLFEGARLQPGRKALRMMATLVAEVHSMQLSHLSHRPAADIRHQNTK